MSAQRSPNGSRGSADLSRSAGSADLGGLTDAEVEQFVQDGAVALRQAIPAELADRCRRALWNATGYRADEPTGWTEPVVRIAFRADAPFREAADTPRLRAAFDRLAGPGRWRPLAGIGTFPIRFPHAHEPDDDGWHIEATRSDAAGTPMVDLASPERVLLLLFLFSDVGLDDAPTRLRPGSHLVAARELMAANGTAGFFELAARVEALSAHLPEAVATGRAGDVWLCHPFLLHAAQANRGTRVRFMAQPPLPGTAPIDPDRRAADRSPVEEAVHRARASG